MMWWLTAKQGPLLPVISPNLQNCFLERSRSKSVKDGVEGAVDGENEYDDPGADCTCKEKENTGKK